ncbi:cardiolipin synthase [Horticoccus sp. 23ND18S-11]|uniref:cardiolipin synthase n=1 Tax=Horticoccus sp. 23ND18S-11 TaxID=3391832 RepID=UPI0039C9E010
MKIVLLVCYFAGWALIPHLLLLKKRPTATLAWLWAIIFIPIVGALAYLAIGTDRLKRRRLKRRNLFSARSSRQRSPVGSTDEGTNQLLHGLPRRDRQFLQLVSRINQLSVSSAETIRILRNSDAFYPALAARIQAARHHIHVEFYIWEADETGMRFLQLLTDAARRGVVVRLLLDGVGSRAFDEDLLEAFREAGGHFSWFQSLDPRRKRFFLNLRNHRKLQIIDGEIAFVGGMNIGRDYEGLNPELGHWRDVQVEATGPVAAELQDVFADDWFFATDERISAATYFPTPSPAVHHPAHIVHGGPDLRNEPISKTIVSLLNEASDRVWIATGYFVPDDILLAALELAASRGVDVRLLISEKNDHPWLVLVGRSYYTQLLTAGVRIFEYSAGINHAKIALADAQWAMVGSANLDYRSMRLNFELNLLFHSASQNAALASILEHDFALSQEIEMAVFACRPFRQRFIEAALRPLSPLL